MTEPPQIEIQRITGTEPKASRGASFVFLGQFPDGASLNVSGIANRVYNDVDLFAKYGQPSDVLNMPDIVRSHFYGTPNSDVFVGNITGIATPGTAAATSDVNDSPVSGAAPTLKVAWRYSGLSGNGYELVIEAGSRSGTASRVDTRAYLRDKITLVRLDETIVEGVMNKNATNYLVAAWNNKLGQSVMTDLALNDTYEAVDEPAIGVYPLTGGVASSAPLEADYLTAIVKLEATSLQNAVIVTDSWSTTALAALAAAGERRKWTIIDWLPSAATPATAETHTVALTNNQRRVVTYVGYGKHTKNPYKSIPLAGVVTAAAANAWSLTGGSVNLTGAMTAIEGWRTGQSYSDADIKGYANARTNPVGVPEGLTGVMVMDVLTNDRTQDWNQWGLVVGEDVVLSAIVNWLRTNVQLNINYPFSEKIDGAASPVSQGSLDRIKNHITNLFTSFPSTLLAGGEGFGWEWSGDTTQYLGDTVPVFTLYLKFAGVARKIILRITQTRSAVTVQAGGAA
jgi:hypothetical protein